MKKKPQDLRIAALARFAIAISALTLLGHGFLGFEQPYAYVVVALATAYVLEVVYEALAAWGVGREPRFRGGPVAMVKFLLPAHISALAIAMLLYANQRLWPVAFAVAVAVGSKYLFNVRTERGTRHFLNPSNTGIATTLLLFPWVGISPPYQFTENLYGLADWLFPAALVVVGTFLNARFTKRIPLIAAWLVGFALQAVLRSWWFDTPLISPLAVVTGLAFLLFTFYMISDPGTTPFKPSRQILFGFSVAMVYGLLMTQHIVFGLFFSLFLVCSARGVSIFIAERLRQSRAAAQAIAVSLSSTESR